MATALDTLSARPDEHPSVSDDIVLPDNPTLRTLAAIFIIGVVGVGLILRFWTRSALWLDEALTINIARQPLHELPGYLKRDGAPPLFYVLEHFWMGLFGRSNLAVRSLSGVLSVATLPLTYLAGKRYGGTWVAAGATILVATSPFAVFYATESRMYALVMFLTAAGFLTLSYAVERSTKLNLVLLGVMTSALIYSQYWALYLAAATAVWLLFSARRRQGDERRHRFHALIAVLIGGATFLPWLPTFIYQSRHTGTPWAAPPNFAAMISVVTGFTNNQGTASIAGSNQGRALAVVYFILAALALFGVAIDRRHIELDLRTRPHARPATLIVVATLFIAVVGGIATKSAFSDRYASVIFIPLILVCSLGLLSFASNRIRAALLAIAALGGLGVAVQNIYTQRTQAPKIAAVLAADARPGDIVAFCPDQLGPDVYRLIAPLKLTTITFPRSTSAEFVDWVDYDNAVRATSPIAFDHELLARAGTHHIWLVWAPGYQGYGIRCDRVATGLLDMATVGARNFVTFAPNHYYEPMSLVEFAPDAR